MVKAQKSWEIFLNCFLYLMTLELSGMKIVTVLAMIYKVFCMMGVEIERKKLL